ncbi:hypothetical protein AUK22_00360 [bacterium CG2_30_54_10]|nr:MAG: hypothetical protein AUK22_00360 [bacterium CG2_30_54_10]
MREFCPRCEAPFPKNSAEGCPACGYRLMTACPTCGHQNVPKATFCGGCGGGMNLSTRVRQRWGSLVSPATRTRFRNLGAGFLFGGVLSIFAFGSMGMSNPSQSKVQPVWAPSEVESPFASPAAQSAFSAVSEWKSEEEITRHATPADLVKVGDLILRKCQPIVMGNSGIVSSDGNDSRRFLQSLGAMSETKEGAPIRRADAALFFYRLASELFSLAAPETSVYQFADIPRYHYLNIPVESLESIGIRIAREPELFGSEDPLSISDLSEVSVDFLQAYENRLKMKVFPSLDPAS